MHSATDGGANSLRPLPPPLLWHCCDTLVHFPARSGLARSLGERCKIVNVHAARVHVCASSGKCLDRLRPLRRHHLGDALKNNNSRRQTVSWFLTALRSDRRSGAERDPFWLV